MRPCQTPQRPTRPKPVFRQTNTPLPPRALALPTESPRRGHAGKSDEGLSRRRSPCADLGAAAAVPSAVPTRGPWEASVHWPARAAPRGPGVAVVGTAPTWPRPGFPTGGSSRSPGPGPATRSAPMGVLAVDTARQKRTQGLGSWSRPLAPSLVPAVTEVS